MKKSFLTILSIFGLAIFSYGQIVSPSVTFSDAPYNHNMHLASDGKFLYTVNGGNVENGQISKFTTEGILVGTYAVPIDMRGIMYNKKDKLFYVNSYDYNIYRISDMASGTYQLVKEGFYDNSQVALALSPKGDEMYMNDYGEVQVYSFPEGKLLNTFFNIKCGEDVVAGSSAIAVDKKYFYTWDASIPTVYIYNKADGSFVKGVSLAKGSYGFSLSTSKSMLFVADDGNYETGTWYGYNLKELLK